MASPHYYSSFSSSKDSGSKRFPIQKKREELEREVFMLEEKLGRELKVRECMERFNDGAYSSNFDIPNDLPPNTKELIVELTNVEMEIAQLQSQINKLQSTAEHERETYIESIESKVWGREAPRHNQETSLSSNIHSRKSLSSNRVAFETKALHFITKAIKGDYKRSNFSTKDKSMAMKESHIRKENGFYDGTISFRQKVLNRTEIIKTPSSQREPRHPTPWRDRGHETLMEIPTKVLATPLHAQEDSINKWSPNKLSENIMRCLIFIFVRMHRASRAMELEKSSPITRSTFLSTSFRGETSSISKSGPIFQKDSRQQDPYGIFDVEDSMPRDIGAYKNLVRFTSSSMDHKSIQNSGSAPLFQKLKIMIDGLRNVDLRFLSHQQKLGFWINMYNACIMHGFLQYGVPSTSSPDKLLARINKASLNIAGNMMNPQVIECFILRKPPKLLAKEVIVEKGDKNGKELIIHDLYGLEAPDPNIAFALCCGTRSSPAVKIYTAEGAISELERSKVEYLQAAIMVTSTKRRIALPELLLWNMHDFVADMESLIDWLCQQLPTSGSLRKSIVDYLRGSSNGGKPGVSAVVEKIPYEFEFQFLLPYER